jgi:Domain of unknown function (DU1801)
MAENKTRPTQASVAKYLGAIQSDARREDCESLAKLMTKVTKQKPVMWGPSIVGFGSYHYKYESGREGDMCLVGFSSRKGDISVYLANFPERVGLLKKLGKHKAGKGCLYIRSLEDVDTKVLEKLVADSVTVLKQRYQ